MDALPEHLEPPNRASRRKSYDRLTGFQVGFYVLLALAEGPAHGAEISRRIVGDTLGLYIGGSSLYDELKRLEQAGLIEGCSQGWPQEWYLTEEGRRRLGLQVNVLKRVREVAQKRRLW